jgi:hypothetical protein
MSPPDKVLHYCSSNGVPGELSEKILDTLRAQVKIASRFSLAFAMVFFVAILGTSLWLGCPLRARLKTHYKFFVIIMEFIIA